MGESRGIPSDVRAGSSASRSGRLTIHAGLLFNRTLHVYTVAPLHPPPTQATQGGDDTLGGHAFPTLANELEQYLNLRLADADGLREQVGAVAETEAEEPPASPEGPASPRRPSKKRRMVPPNPNAVISGVQMAWVGALGLSAFDQLLSRAWGIEIELTAPSDQDPLKCHMVFLPSALGAERAQVGSRTLLYPVLLTSSPPGAGAVGKAAVDQTIAWLVAKFDTSVSSAGGVLATNHGLLPELLETSLSLARAEVQALAVHAGTALPLDPGPVSLTYALPRALEGEMPPPSPDLSTVSLVVPWAVGGALLPTSGVKVPLLPALEAYIRYHASLPLGTEMTNLTAIGVGGVHVSLAPRSVRLKWIDIPSLWAAEAAQSHHADRDDALMWYASFAARARQERVASVLERLRTALEDKKL